MVKTKEELNLLKEEVEALGTKLNELSEDELRDVAGGFIDSIIKNNKDSWFVKTPAGINDIELKQGETPNNIQSTKDNRTIVMPDVNGGNFVVNKADK